VTMIDKALLEAVTRLARQTGDFQLRHFRSLNAGGGDEKTERELVSAVDVESERRLCDGLKTLLPQAGFYGEESGKQGDEQLRWVVDPLDGTTNFLSGIDQFCISIALERSGKAELGVVLRPASGECFSALRGQGLLHNGHLRPQVHPLPLQRALIGTGFPYRSRDLASAFFHCAQDVLYASRGIRRFGAAALDLCYVAAGFFQGFWESDLQPYDVAAALLFLEEAGCVATNLAGEPYSPYRDRMLICGFPDVHRELVPLIVRHYPPTT
jgi:myo-inositol-1(or 4)-monophosphatase